MLADCSILIVPLEEKIADKKYTGDHNGRKNPMRENNNDKGI